MKFEMKVIKIKTQFLWEIKSQQQETKSQCEKVEIVRQSHKYVEESQK